MGEQGGERSPSYGDYQVEIYTKGLLQGTLPPLTTDPNKLRLQAKEVMSPEAYNYIAGGAGEGATMDANRLAFRQWKIVPRMMRPSVPRNLRVNLFGEQYGTFFYSSSFHPDWTGARREVNQIKLTNGPVQAKTPQY